MTARELLPNRRRFEFFSFALDVITANSKVAVSS